MAVRRLLIVNDALADLAGHYYEHDQAIREMHLPLGISTTILANAKFTSDSEADRNIAPLFVRSWMRGDCRSSGRFSFALELLKHNLYIYSVVAAYLKGQYFDCMFVPNATIWDAFAYRALLLTHKPKRFARMVILLRFGMREFQDASAPVGRVRLLLWKILLNSFSQAQRKGVACLATDSARLAAEYEAATGVRPVIFPCPKVVTVERANPGSDPTRPYTFGCLGAARLEKGIDLLQTAAREMLAGHPEANVRFLIQWIEDVRRLDGSLLKKDEMLLGDRRVVFVDRPLSSKEYQEHLQEIDCMVLPYRREKYRSRISGVAVEAATSGISVVYTSDTWLSDFLDSYGAGIAFDDGDVQSLTKAMWAMYRNRNRFNEEAASKRHKALRENSPQRLMEGLWGYDPRNAESSAGVVARAF